MATFDLGDSRAKSFDMEGTRYLAKKGGGIINVDRPDHVRKIRENTGLKEWCSVGLATTSTDGIICTSCNFHQWSFMEGSPCPRCGKRDWVYEAPVDNATYRKAGY